LLIGALLWSTIQSIEIENPAETGRRNLRYHLAVFIEKEVSDSWIKGLQRGAQASQSALDMVFLTGSPQERHQTLSWKWEAHILGGVHGILFLNQNITLTPEQIALAREHRVPFLLVNGPTEFQLFENISQYQLGRRLAQQSLAQLSDSRQYAVLGGREDYRAGEDFYRGIRSVLSRESRMRERDHIFVEENQIYGMEALSTLWSRYPQLDLLFCRDHQIALGAAAFLIDRNLVDQIQIYTLGQNPQVRELVDKEIIHTALYYDEEILGEESVSKLISLMNYGVYDTSRARLELIP